MAVADIQIRRSIEKELVKRDIELNLITVSVTNLVVHLEGELRPVRGFNMDVRRERDIIEEIVRNMKGVRDVVNHLRVPL